MNYKNVLLDLDDVLADFVGQFGREYGYNTSGLDTWQMSSYLGISEENFVKKLNALGIQFWGHLPKLDKCDDLVELLNSLEPTVYIVSAPTDNVQAWSGKKFWIRHNLPHIYSDRLVLTRHKHLLANKETLLIDDSPKNVKKFKENGGFAIAYPRKWNSSEKYIGSELKYVKSVIEHGI